MMLRSLARLFWWIALISPAPVYAQSVATFASGNGNDSFDCLTPATACRQISAALTKTLAGGTIHVLPGTYLGFFVTQSVNIIAEGEASVINSGVVHAIRVNLTSGVVRVNGLLIRGVSLQGSGTIHIERCILIPPSPKVAVEFELTTGPSQLYITDTTVGLGFGGGVLIRPNGASASVKAVLDLVRMSSISVEGSLTADSISVELKNTVVGSVAIRDESASGATTNVMIEESLVSGGGVVSNGARSTVRMRDSTVRQAPRGLLAGVGGKLISHGGNVIVDNQTNGTFTSIVPQQ